MSGIGHNGPPPPVIEWSGIGAPSIDARSAIDGFRIQLHKDGCDVRLFSRNGKDFTERFPSIAAAVRRLGAKNWLSTGELVSCERKVSRIFTRCCAGARPALCVLFRDRDHLIGPGLGRPCPAL